jgi:uncharacterized protein YndB with AHSA1/START domain
MTGPEGDEHHAWWRITSADPPKSLEFVDGFAHQDGTPNPDLPVTHTHVTLTEHEGGTRMHLRAQFDSKEQMDQLLTMGMDQGLTQAVTQMDALLTP